MQNPNVGKKGSLKSIMRNFTYFYLTLEKVIPGKVSGEGVKKTPAYDTPYTRTELEKWRKEFWGNFIFRHGV